MPGHYRYVLLALLPAVLAASPQDAQTSGANCSFLAAPDAFRNARQHTQIAVHERVSKLDRSFSKQGSAAQSAATASPADIPHRNFIDDEIFNKLAAEKVAPARLTTDEEFLRRITLDLTGRIPSSADIRTFVASTDPAKRDNVIEKLLYSNEFNDKWTMWWGDLTQNNITQVTAAVNRQTDGRNRYKDYLYFSVAGWKSVRDIAFESISATGNNYDVASAASNFIMGGSVTGGPTQDTYDGMLVRTATAFLGQGNYDCLLCHNGRGHLDQINLWGSQTSRQQAQSMAAFFSRTSLNRYPAPNPPAGQTSSDPYFNSTNVEDVAVVRSYDLNTNYGNRPNRVPYGTLKTLTPSYQFTNGAPSDSGWRSAFAEFVVDDPMFNRNMANRLWKQMFNMGLVEPADQLDPARLDPANPPPDPWTLQATHPVLLEKLAGALRDSNWDMRGFLRLLVQSNAYQLSSRYDGTWNIAYVPLFARHFPRRLEGEEIHDVIAQTTGVTTKYTVAGYADPFQWAMQLPDPQEPRSNGSVANFMNAFLRGNRDTTQRSQASSILQQLNLMNDPFVTGRTKVTVAPTLLSISKLTDNNAVIDEVWLTFLARLPTNVERTQAAGYLKAATTATARNTVIEDLAWVAINKLDFLFSY